MPHEQNQQKIERLISNAPGIIEEFRKAYFNTALSLARAYNLSEDDAEDAFQEALVAIFQNARAHGTAFLVNATLNTYIRAICNNQFHTVLLRNNNIISENVIKQLDAIHIDKEEHLQWALEKKELIEKTQAALPQMEEPCRSILKDRYTNGLKHKEIADKYDSETNQIGMKVKRCLEKFRKMFPTFD